MSLQAVIEDFVAQLRTAIEEAAVERARASVLEAFGIHTPRKPGRPPKTSVALVTLVGKPRKKAPRQLCPVPGCKNPAAPIFGMVCAKHKDVPKAQIKKFREARRAKKLGLSPAATRPAKTAAKRPSKATAKRATVKRAAAKRPRVKAKPAPMKAEQRSKAISTTPAPIAVPAAAAPVPALPS